MKKTFLVTSLMCTLLLSTPVSAGSKSGLMYEVEATQPRLIRNVTGPVTSSVSGVPAEPVDSFALDGVGTTLAEGQMKVKIDPVNNTGVITAEWVDENGHWTFRQTIFNLPGHPTGARIGPSINDRELIDDPISTNIYLHGDSGAAAPVLPTVLNHFATWGVAELTLNGISFDNPFNGPVPNWGAHTMLSEGVRDETDGSIRSINGEVYNPAESGKGAVDHNDLELHLVIAAPAAENTTTANFPPPFAFFYHLTFENVKLKIRQR